MKLLKNIALTGLLTIGAFSAVTYTSCTTDKCKDVICQNGGTCSDGNCACATGYEGKNCETVSRLKFIKTWTSSDTEVGGNAVPTYNAIVSAGTEIYDVKIGKFSDNFFTNDVKATVSGNTISIAPQSPDNDNYYVSGSGTFDATTNKITWSYTLTSPTNQTKTYSGSWQ